MNAILLNVALLALCIFLFFREDKIRYKKYLERDRVNEERMLERIEEFVGKRKV